MTDLHTQIQAWYRSNRGCANLIRAVKRIKEELDELLLGIGCGNTANIAEELADVYICLVVAAQSAGVDIEREAWRKQRINLQRKWYADKDGALYHIKGSDPRGGDK